MEHTRYLRQNRVHMFSFTFPTFSTDPHGQAPWTVHVCPLVFGVPGPPHPNMLRDFSFDSICNETFRLSVHSMQVPDDARSTARVGH